jgi:uncharacterized protein (TIGR03083 family)
VRLASRKEAQMSEDGLRAVEVLASRYAEVVRSLRSDEWTLPSRCPGWSVQDLVAHTGSNFHVVAEPDVAPKDPPPIAEDLQDLLVEERRGWSAEQVADEFERYREPALAAFRAVQAEPLASSPLTMSELGTYPMHTLADAFAFDLWCHLHVDLLAPTGPVQREVPAPEDDLVKPGIGWMLTGLPQMCPSVSKVLDRPLGLHLTGPGGGQWTLQPGHPYLVVADGDDEAAAARVTSSAVEFILWGTARVPWREYASVDGDAGYAARILDEINIV